MRTISVNTKIKAVLDPTFTPAVLWNREYRKLAEADKDAITLGLALEQADGTCFVHRYKVLPHTPEHVVLNRKYVERIIKFLLWMQGGCKVYIGGNADIAALIASIYSSDGERAFDYKFMGKDVYGKAFEVVSCALDKLPAAKSASMPLGRNFDGCRIGFDLGGSDRKCAAVKDGEVLFTEEIPWDPYFQSNPQYHYDGIMDSLKRAAAHLPRVDAIGGSSAGVYVNNEVRVASLFRGVSGEDFENSVRRLFFRLKQAWNDIPFEVVNDGEVTALAGSMSMQDNGVLGISMGTSQAGGYVDMNGHIQPWLDELAFAPIDYRDDAPADEWSGDIGCGVQYFSQQGVARLIPLAGIRVPKGMPFPEQLVEVQKLMDAGDERARKIYETIGVCFGYAIAHYADFYIFRNLLFLGRVSSGKGGDIIMEKANAVLKTEFPELAKTISIKVPNEQDKRHGQAVAAASLPKLKNK